jgi:uncharacterized membrane protein
MNAKGNLWVVAFDGVTQAEAFRGKLLGMRNRDIIALSDVVLVERNLDGSFAATRENFSASGAMFGASLVGLLAGLVLTQPLLGAAIGAAIGAAGATAIKGMGLDEDFIREVGDLIKPGTAALFLLSRATDIDAVLHNIRGLGGKVVQTDVDLDLAKQAQLALESAKPPQPKV